jgi:hypothetical protein
MKIKDLVNSIVADTVNLNFEFDSIGFTWGLSYMRIVIGDKNTFKTVENFFFNTFRSDKNITSGIQGSPAWSERVNLIGWANGLIIEEIDCSEVKSTVDYFLEEIQKYQDYWIEENTINPLIMYFPEDLNQCWRIKETIDSRHYINTTESFLSTTPSKFTLVEMHYES